MRYMLQGERNPNCISVDACFYDRADNLVAEEDLMSFVKKLVIKIGTFFDNHHAMCAYVKDNMKLLEDLNPESIVCTVMPKDLSAAGNALEEINEGLQKLRLGGKVNLAEFCTDTLAKVGIVFNRGRISIVDFLNGNWGEGRDKTDLDHPMTYHKKIVEFGWDNGAKNYAERFIRLTSDVTTKGQLIAASNRHYTDVKKAMARGIGKSHAIFEKEVAIDQINQINATRDALVKFYFSQIRAIMKGANIQEIKPMPREIKLPNTWTGK